MTNFRKIRQGMGLLRTQQQGHNVESICDSMVRLRAQYPKAGCREVKSILFHEESISVSR